MKKRTRDIIIFTSVGAIVLGFILCLIAFAAIGKSADELSILQFKHNEYTVEENFQNIEIDAMECDIILRRAESEKCIVNVAENSKIYCDISVSGNTLSIKRKDTRKWYEKINLFLWNNDITLTVFLPKDAYESLRIKTVSGDTDISEKFTFLEVDIESVSGDTEFGATVHGPFTAESTSGNFEFENANVTGALCIKTVSGDVEAENSSFSSAVITTVSGNVKADAVLFSAAFNAESQSGDVELRGSDAAELNINTVSGDVECNLLSLKRVETSTTSGDVKVSKSSLHSPLCVIRTVSGDIKVNFKESN